MEMHITAVKQLQFEPMNTLTNKTKYSLTTYTVWKQQLGDASSSTG